MHCTLACSLAPLHPLAKQDLHLPLQFSPLDRQLPGHGGIQLTGAAWRGSAGCSGAPACAHSHCRAVRRARAMLEHWSQLAHRLNQDQAMSSAQAAPCRDRCAPRLPQPRSSSTSIQAAASQAAASQAAAVCLVANRFWVHFCHCCVHSCTPCQRAC